METLPFFLRVTPLKMHTLTVVLQVIEVRGVLGDMGADGGVGGGRG